jgi:glycosyltransferase involved in cell wall biosynthesis
MTTVSDAPMELTLLCSRFRPEQHGGVEERLWRVAQALAARGVEVKVVTENRLGLAAAEVLAPRLCVRRIQPFDAGRLWRIGQVAQVHYWRRAVMAQDCGHIVCATEPAMAVGALLASPRPHVIFNPAACAAAMRRMWEQRPELYSMNLPRHLAWVDRMAYRHADDVVVSSENVKRQFEKFYGPRSSIHVLRYAGHPSPAIDRDVACRRFGFTADDFCVGFAGRLDPCKDVPFLLHALKRLPPRTTDRLLIVGEGPDEHRVRRAASELGLDSHIVWAGRLNSTDEAFVAMDVLVLPSVYEAFGLVLVEAMSVGTPVITRADDGETVFTASSEIVTPESGIVVPSNDVEALADALRLLRDSPDLRARLGVGAKRTVSRRSWDDLAKEYVSMITDTRKNRRRWRFAR